MPKQTITDIPQLLRIHVKNALGLQINYFDLRPSLTPDGKKRADMAFLTHVIRKCDRDAENTSWSERMRYHRTRLLYLPELSHVNRNVGKPEADNYILRWGYLLDHNPSFDELIHGTDGGSAWYALESLE